MEDSIMDHNMGYNLDSGELDAHHPARKSSCTSM